MSDWKRFKDAKNKRDTYFIDEKQSLTDRLLMSDKADIASKWLMRLSLLVLFLVIGIDIGIHLKKVECDKILNEIIVVNQDNKIVQGEWINDKRIYQLKQQD